MKVWFIAIHAHNQPLLSKLLFFCFSEKSLQSARAGKGETRERERERGRKSESVKRIDVRKSKDRDIRSEFDSTLDAIHPITSGFQIMNIHILCACLSWKHKAAPAVLEKGVSTPWHRDRHHEHPYSLCLFFVNESTQWRQQCLKGSGGQEAAAASILWDWLLCPRIAQRGGSKYSRSTFIYRLVF